MLSCKTVALPPASAPFVAVIASEGLRAAINLLIVSRDGTLFSIFEPTALEPEDKSLPAVLVTPRVAMSRIAIS